MKYQKIQKIIQTRKFIIIGSPASNNYQVVQTFIDHGIDIIKLHLNMTHPVSNVTLSSLKEEESNIYPVISQNPQIVWGIVPGNLLTNPKSFEEIPNETLQRLFDFVDLFYYSYTAHYLKIDLPKMVAIDRVLQREELSILERMGFWGIETSIVDKNSYGLPLTLQDIINLERIVKNTTIPIFVPTQKKITPKDVRILYDIGAKGIVLGQISTSLEIDTARKIISEFVDQVQKL
ncbi:MAG: hypothetical protein ABDH21_05945 [bacterium]